MESFGKPTESSSLLTPIADLLSPHASGYTNICNSCGSNTGLERLDASKLNQLLDHVRTRLSSDFYGNLFIEGGNLAKDKRHGDLGELFNLMAKLDSFKASMDKYIELHTPKEAPKPEKPGKLNENMSATVRNIVELQVEARFRDLTIRCERLEEQLKNSQSAGNEKAVKAKQANSIKIAELENKVDDNKKATAREIRDIKRVTTNEINDIKKTTADESKDTNKATVHQLNAVRRDLVKLDQTCRTQNANIKEELALLKINDDIAREAILDLRVERSDLQEQIDDHAKDIERVVGDLADVEGIAFTANAEVTRLMRRMNGRN
ncbi:hypothetical protein KC343_g10424 [Hortaea werneckii]|nr:hypothetical protein KC352_g19431 [Hortaea werneckii]KAI7559051.1 hypothetical protein KC317_g10608 [Hortaea werneckii]KAI7606959.1 hypothetical protein KC346_g10283 [Hortaea werneckii]KAI7614595.1 hypothetical protein KC343_g10424 [Hortaea werneckii]KAI7654634.1 hypothetical protein KC319_g10218 [Hortaea werneckii]